jgi:hypothetical protein
VAVGGVRPARLASTVVDQPASVSHGRAFASDHVVWVVDAGLTPVTPGDGGNGLMVVTQPGAALLFTGINTGYVNVTVDARTEPPEGVDVADWDEVCEVSMEAPGGRLAVLGPMAPNEGELGWLSAVGPGCYRVRVHARGRGALVDGVAYEPIEDYLFLSWPHPPAPERTHKAAGSS